MAHRSQWLGLMVLACAGTVAAIVSTSAFSASPPETAPAEGAPYTTATVPEIAKLKGAPNNPTSVEDLRAIQTRVEAVVKHAMPAVVALTIISGREVEEGSGVIVSKDGYILTAGHVSGQPHTQVGIILSNGQRVRGESLGAQTDIDSGMVKIDTKTYPADYPFVPLGNSDRLSAGEWVVDLGHPGGYEATRPPVVRIGRVLRAPDPQHGDPSRGHTEFIRTDCEMIMGDSGGPLFDLDGRLVGINSRIGMDVDANIHVPVNTFEDHWMVLAGAELLKSDRGIFGAQAGASPKTTSRGSLGASVAENLKVLQVFEGGAADLAHLRPEDVITKVNGKAVKTRDELSALLRAMSPGTALTVDYLRGDKPAEASVTLLSEPDNP